MKNKHWFSAYFVAVWAITTLLIACDSNTKNNFTEAIPATKEESGFSFGFSKGIKKDITTGLKTTNDGLSYDEVFLVNDQNEKLSSNEMALQTSFSVVLTDVDGFRLKTGNAYPGIAIVVSNAEGLEIMNTGDLLAEYKNGVALQDAKTLTASFTVGKPMQTGKYHFKARFWDKNGKGEIISELDLNVKG